MTAPGAVEDPVKPRSGALACLAFFADGNKNYDIVGCHMLVLHHVHAVSVRLVAEIRSRIQYGICSSVMDSEPALPRDLHWS